MKQILKYRDDLYNLDRLTMITRNEDKLWLCWENTVSTPLLFIDSDEARAALEFIFMECSSKAETIDLNQWLADRKEMA